MTLQAPKEQGINLHEFNPFHHGLTTIRSVEVRPEITASLAPVVELGWGLKFEGAFLLDNQMGLTSNNYQVETNMGTVLLKRFFGDQALTEEVNECLNFCAVNGAKVPRVYPTKERKTTFASPKGEKFTLHHYIDNPEHFDGSRIELIQTAQELAKLHLSLKRWGSPGAGGAAFKSELSGHNRSVFDKTVRLLSAMNQKSEFDQEIRVKMPQIQKQSAEVWEKLQRENLPVQLIHRDLHPNNSLFNSETKSLAALIDFENLTLSQRIRDVAFTMHRFSRTYGPQTERQQDIGANILTRAGEFLEAYNQVSPLTQEEIAAIPLILRDETLDRLSIMLRKHYFENNRPWSRGFADQLTLLQEVAIFESLPL